MSKMGYKEIHEILKKQIIWLELKPESILQLSDLADSFGVSRGPVKEALLILEAEGWLLRNGTQFMVTPLTMNRVKEIVELRSIMEVQGYIWAMHRITSDEMVSLKKIKKKILQHNETDDYMKMFEIELEFFRIMNHASHNSHLTQLLDRWINHFLRYWLSKIHEIRKESLLSSLDSVLEMIKAVEKKDEALLRKAVSAHLTDSFNEIMRMS